MSAEYTDHSLTQVREVISRLQSPVSDLTILRSLLSSPLACIGLLPPRFRRYNVTPLPDGALNVHRHFSPLQRALLEHIIPTWDSTLADKDETLLVEQYFCPDTFSFSSVAAGEVTLLAYSSILSLPLTEYSVRLLERLSKEYPVDRLHTALFSNNSASTRRYISWEDCIRDIVSIPAKVANALGGICDIPPILNHGPYFNNVSVRCEALIYSMSTNAPREISSVSYLLAKLVNLGVFPPTPPASRSQPSFFQVTLPIIRARLNSETQLAYFTLWREILASLSTTSALQSILTSLFSSLSQLSSGLDPSPLQRSLVKQEATLLRQIVGPVGASSIELRESAFAIILSREWSEGHARIFACWIAGAEGNAVDEDALELLLRDVVDIWANPGHVKHSLLTRHRYVTSILLVTLSYFHPLSPRLLSLALSSSFISGVGIYIGHLDNSIRHCGMLVAEVVAQLAGKKLDFDDWQGDDAGKPWARNIRMLLHGRDVDADISEESGLSEDHVQGIYVPNLEHKPADLSKKPVVPASTEYDSDDSLAGYASPGSSRSVSPTLSELEQIEKDPTLRVGVKKILRPVYLAQLGEMVRGTSVGSSGEDQQEADRIELALSCAEDLIRKKSSYGMELEENAVNLVYGLVGLQDNYDLENFEVKRQGAVNALVACCPRKAAPAIIEEFFKNQYSTNQRYVMLNALALGARELALLPLSSALQPVPSDRTSFPSKFLPPHLHQRYLGTTQYCNDVRHLLDGISREAVGRNRDTGAEGVPKPVRERQLRIRTPAKVAEVKTTRVDIAQRTISTGIVFTAVAAEFFLSPLINRFWLFLRDEQSREERTAHRDALYRYHGAGTGLILNAIVLSHFLGTLAVLVHASQNAPEWLAVVAPDALELAVTLGTRPVSQGEAEDEDGKQSPNGIAGETRGKEASVLTTSLELALVVLDGCLQLDGGRSLGLDHTALLLGAGEWAGRVFAQLEKGVLVEGGGGAQAVTLKRTAAGVLLKVEEFTSRWRRSMVDVR